jgi:CRP-like cAMP-binding protein
MVATAARACTWYIRQVDLFRHLAEHDADGLAHAMSLRHFSSGQLIVDRHTRPELVCVMRTGTVRLFTHERSGREVTVERLANGQLFGVTGLLTPDAGGLLAQAETDVDVCVVDGRRFLDLVSEWPLALLELATRLGVRVREADEAMNRLTPTGARARLAEVLHRLARTGSDINPGGGLRLRGVPRHADLALEIGVTRETVTRMLARLEQDGYIRRFGRHIVVPDPDRLADDFDLPFFDGPALTPHPRPLPEGEGADLT